MESLDLAALVDQAYAPDVTEASALQLLDVGGYQIALALASNEVTPRETLTLIAERYPAAFAAVAGHPSASVEIKNQLPLGAHTGYSLEVYLNDQRATPAQRAALLEEFKFAEPGSGPLLGAAWDAIVRRQRREDG
jgi:hypothetical protein